MTRVKVKVGAERAEDLEVLAAVREALGAEASLRVDANAAWDAETALARLRDFERFRLERLRAAVRGRRLRGHGLADGALAGAGDRRRVARLAARMRERLVELRACHVFNVRISKCGGLLGRGPHPRSRDARPASTRCSEPTWARPRSSPPPAATSPRARPGCASPRAPTASSCCEADVSDAMDLGAGGWGPAIARDGLGLDVDLGAIAPYITSCSKLTA